MKSDHIVDIALKIAVKAHAGQRDLVGEPYIMHVLRVFNAVDFWQDKYVALLHDVLEDSDMSDMTVDRLLSLGVPYYIVKSVEVLTRLKGQDYAEYIMKIAANPTARAVKIADLEDNLDISRLKALTVKDTKRILKYHAALNTLKTLKGR